MIRVAVADDQPLVREGFATIVSRDAGLVLVGEAADGRAAVELARSARPDVFLMDVRMPEMDGIEATGRITADPATAAVKVVILTTFDLDEYVYAALRAGASGFLLKDVTPEGLLDAIRLVAAGDAMLAPRITRRLIERFAAEPVRRAPDERALALLTDREREVVALVGRGLSNQEIAERLSMSPATAKTHVVRALAKLQARDRAQLVVMAYESGLVSPGS
ncbi:MAG TPA: response regulator transcription factor, partial [Acidimicrobiales bacterium]|nr:response regulator transcription factor [Acidimicrobiales bacterium]